MMRIFEEELNARERIAISNPSGSPEVSNSQCKKQPRLPTATALYYSSTSANASVICAYCDKNHFLALCTTITDVTARKEILRKTGRCFVCLRKNHLSHECRSRFSCKKCRGRHHSSICMRQDSGQVTSTSAITSSSDTSTSSSLRTHSEFGGHTEMQGSTSYMTVCWIMQFSFTSDGKVAIV